MNQDLGKGFYIPRFLRIIGAVFLLIPLVITGFVAGMYHQQLSTPEPVNFTSNPSKNTDAIDTTETNTTTSPTAEASIQSKFIDGTDYYILNECGVAVPRPNDNSKYSGLSNFDSERYWAVTPTTEHAITTSVTINYIGTPTDVANNSLKYANDYYVGLYSVSCNDLPSGVTTLDQLLANKQAVLAANDNGSGFSMSEVATKTKWGVTVMQYKTTGGQYSEDYESYWVIKGDKYISISGLINSSANAGIAADWRTAMDNMLFF